MALSAATITTDIPLRLDRLPWARWHWMVVIALGITWILDGLEVTIVGTIGPTLTSKAGLSLSDAQASYAGSAYIVGACIGALGFGYLTDRFGRKRLFLVTLTWYLACTLLSAFSWDFWSFALFRMLAGAGIGGEYSAVNSAIDELIPAKRRGITDIAINGSWWIGTLLGAVMSIPLLDGRFIAPALGWRLAFGLGAVLAVAVLFVRNGIPESPRWLLTHGRHDEAERIASSIERAIVQETGAPLPDPGGRVLRFSASPHRSIFVDAVRTMVRTYPRRTALVLTLMITQAFLYNAVFFTQGLTLTTFFGVKPGDVGLFLIPFAVGNFLGALVLGHFFDTIGRKRMIAGCYLVSGALLLLVTYLFLHGMRDATQLTLWFGTMFFFASAGASAAYLTTSEIFPLETRAAAIAVVYAVGTLIGGAVAPPVYGFLIGTKEPSALALAWSVGATLMIAGGVVEIVLGVDAENRPLEEVASPLTQVGAG